jgi:DNA-binding XRE family transcriptional regulator
MMFCSEHAPPSRPGVAYEQHCGRWSAMKHTPSEDDSLILSALGDAIREHRVQAGLTQAELAQRAGIGRPHLNHIEGGRKNPTVVVLVQLAASLGVAPGDLFCWYSVSKASS